jgi:2-methylisocitrate lyase-like PEP mutase family enzyme
MVSQPPATNHLRQIVGVYDALSAKIADQFRFDWLSLGGYNVSGSRFGLPDVGVVTFSEMLETVRIVTNCTSRPLLVDGDDGYGNYLNVIRMVREVERTGAAAIHMEDQVLPKRCGHMRGKRVIATQSFVAKIKAFVDTRRSEQFLLFARTDAIAVNGFDDAIERGNRYLEAGADVIFVEAPVSMQQAADIPRLIDGPVLYNWVYGGKSPLIHPDKLSELGYSYYFQADVLFAVSRALQRYFSELKTTGTYGQAQEHMATFDEFNEFVGLAEVIAAEQRYGTAPIPCAADSERR